MICNPHNNRQNGAFKSIEELRDARHVAKRRGATHRGLLHDRGREAGQCALPFQLLPQGPLIDDREATGAEQIGQALARRRRAVDAELQWFAGRPDRSSQDPPRHRLRLEHLGREVVEGNDAALGGAGDLARVSFVNSPLKLPAHVRFRR
jgi:hypothetical protein